MSDTTADGVRVGELPLSGDAPAAKKKDKKKTVKCVVWDLDHTVWDGILLEDGKVPLKAGVVEIMKELDERGILQSVASRNEHEPAMQRLVELGIADYFLYPRINWNAKGGNIEQIAKDLNIGIDTFLFIDDQPFERDEVQHTVPAVRVWDANDLSGLLAHEDLNPEFITDDSRKRRAMYQADAARNAAESDFSGPTEEFLSGLHMRFTIAPCGEEDLKRAEELTVRTNQLNTTGYTYDYHELDAFRHSPDHLLLVAGLEDRYGTYGKIGLTLVEKGPEAWTVKLLLMSCRVMSRGVGTILMGYLMEQAKAAGVKLRAEFKHNGRNRMMYITYKFGGFKELEQRGDLIVFEHDLENLQPFPAYVDVTIG